MTPITQITINGKGINLRFGMHVIESVAQLTVTRTGISNLVKIVWGAIENYYFVINQPTPVSFEEVYDWVEDIHSNDDPNGILLGIATAWRDSKAFQKVMEREGILDKKKAAPSEEIPIKKEETTE